MSILTKHILTNKYPTLFTKAGINTTLRLSHFFAQADHESKLKPSVESLNYAAEALIDKFGRHRISINDANKYGRTSKQAANQQAIANTIYGGKWGLENLGNKVWGDGWKYRGRGIFQITGLSNYTALTKYAQNVLGLDVDYVENPDLLLQEADSLIAAIWYWNTRNLNSYADKDDALSISKSINLGNPNAKGTPLGLDERKEYVKKYKKVFI